MIKDDIEKLLNIGVVENWLPGYSYASLYHDKIIKGYGGYRETYPQKINNNENTLYDMASLTKVVVTNTLLWRLVEKGKINLQDSVKKYFNEFKYDFITIEHLATHTSGFVSDIDYRIFNTREKIITEIMSPKIIQKPGEFAYYSDINYILLGLVLEKCCNMDFNTLIINEVLKPLKMNKSCFIPSNKEICAATEITEERGIVKGVVHDEKADILGGIAGHAGLFSHVDDLINFCQMILNDGVFDGKQFLSKATIDCWFQKKYFDQNLEVNRGFSWVVGNNILSTGENVSENTISHTGFTGTSILIDRENKYAFIYLTNRVHPTRSNKYFRYFRKKILNYTTETIFQQFQNEKTFQK